MACVKTRLAVLRQKVAIGMLLLAEGWAFSLLPRGRLRRRIVTAVDSGLRRIHLARCEAKR